MKPGEVWQYAIDPGVVILVLESKETGKGDLLQLRFAYLTFDSSPSAVGGVFERVLSSKSHVRVA